MTLIISSTLTATVRRLNADTDGNGLVTGDELTRAVAAARAEANAPGATAQTRTDAAELATAATFQNPIIPTLDTYATARLSVSSRPGLVVAQAREIASRADRSGDNDGNATAAEVRGYCQQRGIRGPAAALAASLEAPHVVVIYGRVQMLPSRPR